MLTLKELAEKLSAANYWEKEDLKRIYLDRGHNTKKMSTKTFIFEKDGEFIVSCHVDCPSQAWQWCKSQEEEVKESVYNSIKRATATEVFYFVDATTEKIVDVDGNECTLDLLSVDSDYFFSAEEAVAAIDESPKFLIAKMDRAEFDEQVMVLEQIERNLPLKFKIERGDRIRYSIYKEHVDNDITRTMAQIKELEELDIDVTCSLSEDLNYVAYGSFFKRNEGQETARVIIERGIADYRAKKLEYDSIKTKHVKVAVKNVENGKQYKHAKFGIGTMISSDGKVAALDFNGTIKKLILEYAKLEEVK